MRVLAVPILLGLSWLVGCSAPPVSTAEIAPEPVRTLAPIAADGALFRFQDDSGRLRHLHLGDAPDSIQLDPRPSAAWPTFLDERPIDLAHREGRLARAVAFRA